MKHEVKLGEIVYARPGDTFSFTPPKPGRMYRFQVGPSNGTLWIGVWISGLGPTESWISNYEGEDFVDAVCHQMSYSVTVDGCRTAYQLVVTRTPHPFLVWVKSLFRGKIAEDNLDG